MNDLLSGIAVFGVLSLIAMICFVKLLNLLYKAQMVKAEFTKDKVIYGSFNYSSGEQRFHEHKYFTFKTKKGEEKTLRFNAPLSKKGSKILLMYNEYKNKLTGRFTSIFVIAPLFAVLSWMVLSLDMYMAIGYVIVVALTILIYLKKYKKGDKSEK